MRAAWTMPLLLLLLVPPGGGDAILTLTMYVYIFEPPPLALTM